MRQLWIATLGGTLAGFVATAAPRQAPRLADWLTDGGDAQRTAWQQHETALSPATVKGMTLLWTIQLDNAPRQMHALFPPLIAGQVETTNGPRQVAIVAGVSNNIYAIDVEAGTLVWSKHFERGFTPPFDGRPPWTLCPGGLLATPTLSRTGPQRYVAYVVTWDGRLHTLDAGTGEETGPPVKFIPPNGKPYSLNLLNDLIVAGTSEGCGDNPDRLYAYDLRSKSVAWLDPDGGGLWGRRGPSFGADGTIFTPTGDNEFDPRRRMFGESIIAATYTPATRRLTLKDYFAPPNADWMTLNDLDMNTTGAVFTHAGREWIVESSKECRLWLLDTASLGGASHRAASYTTPVMCNEHARMESAGVWGALATWTDSAGARWIAAPFWGPKHPQFSAPLEHGTVTNGAVTAFQLVERDGRVELAPRWISRDMNRADPPVVANGVVFGYGSGESTTQTWTENGQRIDQTSGRVAHSTHAVIYALDAATGDELWSSGDQIASWNHFSGLSVANGRVYIGTYDGKLYCFGVSGAPAVGRRSGRPLTSPF